MNTQQFREDIIEYGDKLFMNSASSSLVVKSVLEKISDYLQVEARHGGYWTNEKYAPELDLFYKEAAQLLHAEAHQIAIVQSATEGYIKALSSIPFQKDDVLLTTEVDYNSNFIQFISLKKRFGIKIIIAQHLENGDLDIPYFEKLVQKHSPKLVAVTHVPTNSGMIQDVEAVGKICAENEILYLVDACQSVGQLVVDVQKIKCDFLTATGRKFLRGPRGTGILYVSDKVLNREMHPLFIDGHGAEWTDIEDFRLYPSAKRFETFESSRALQMGITEALRYLNTVGIQNVQSYNEGIIKRLRNNLSAIPTIQMYDNGSSTSNILTFRKTNKSIEDIKSILDKNKVYFSISSRAYGLIDFDKKGIDSVIRLSPHYFNTMEEIDKVSEIIESI